MHEWVTHQSARGHYFNFTGIIFSTGISPVESEGKDDPSHHLTENYVAGFLLKERALNYIPAIRRVTVNKK